MDATELAASLSRTRMATEIANRKASLAQRFGAHRAVHLAATDIAATMARDNPEFDRTAFMRACGFA